MTVRPAINAASKAMGDGTMQHSSATSDALPPILDRHCQWWASGWESGKRADLHGWDLHEIDLNGVLLMDADLHRADLHNAQLNGAELEGADLHRADLSGADMRDADLHWADLHDADLHGADLRGAVLDEADLHRADLHAADLTDAALSSANLRGADLRETCGLTHAQLATAVVDSTTKLPLGIGKLLR